MTWAATATAAAATVAGSAIQADAMKDAAGQSGTSTTATSAPAYIQPQYARLASDIGELRARGLFGDIQTLSPYERSLVERGMTTAQSGDPFQEAGTKAVSNLLAQGGLLGEAADVYRGVAGDSMSSPAFQAASQRIIDRTMRPLTSKFAAGGRLGSGLFASTAGEAAAEALAPMMFDAQQQDIANRMAAAQGLTGIAGEEARRTGVGLEAASAVGQMPFTDIQRGLALGGLLSSEDYAQRQAEVTGAQRYSDMLRGATVGQQQTQPLYSPNYSGLGIGAALTAAAPQIGQAFANYNSNPNPFGSLSAGPTDTVGGQTYAQQPDGRFVNQRFVGMGG